MCLRVGVQVQNGLKRSRFEQLLVGFDGGQRHPVEREQQHEHDQPERQIERHQPPRQRFEIAHALGVIGSRCRADGLGAGEELSHCSLPAAISGTARGACPVSRQGKSCGEGFRSPTGFAPLAPSRSPAGRGSAPPSGRAWWIAHATAELSHCFRPAAISVAAGRTTRAGWRPAGTGSSRSRSPRLRRDSRRGSRADSSASPSDGWR